ncbi:hypothetical protein BST83_04140 [Polaribacter filamentus]|uniref:Alkyl hydroperoxide reductase subunit C/ Thiol specific antioxidant domain-containing protein n=1 Tax=Polaribacter filamentus TaxID=53483 RepID=A0A2S7KVB5_9FLAO|nr:redoxin domain-containing protein [Polaribacter filamentus]PQB06453.1 hypothetical protein BST83_04140 [Polaribacter filamentus]
MKQTILLLFFLCGFTFFGQEKSIKKPEYVIIVNNEIITKEQLEASGKNGAIKSMDKGATQEERNQLAKNFGNKIGDKDFILQIAVSKEQELLIRKKEIVSSPKNTDKKQEIDELKLHVNEVASDFTVKMMNGEKITLSNLKGNVVLLNYWATRCAPCLIEFSDFPKKILKPFEG